MDQAACAFALGTFSRAGVWRAGASGTGQAPFVGLVVRDRVLDLDPYATRFAIEGPLSTRSLLEHWDGALAVLRELASQIENDEDGSDLTAVWTDVQDLTVLVPVQPHQILQAGANYRTHVLDLSVKHAELSAGRTEEQVRRETAAMMDTRAAEGIPYFFIGLPTALTGAYDDVTLPAYSTQHDWELELAVVIGRRACRVDREQALDHVAAYTIVNDLTTRDLVFRRDMPEIGTDWFRAKNAPGFLPLGPYLVPAEFVGDPGDLRLTLSLNGQVMQDETTKDMIFDVAALVAHASQTVPLLPGDLILTGSPAGNGLHHGRLLRAGDVMEATITGLGTQRTRCVDEAKS